MNLRLITIAICFVIIAISANAIYATTVCEDSFYATQECYTDSYGNSWCGGVTWYHDQYCYEAGGGGSGDDGCCGGSGDSDSTGNGVVDNWLDVVSTTNPCATNIDDNDGLGENHGGSNSTRPDHDGVDLQANGGDPVYPFMDGTVDAVGWSQTGCGYRVVIKNVDGNLAVYCHMEGDSSSLTYGQHVFAGATLIGSVDSTGHSSGDHLHIGVKDANGNTVWGSSYYDYTKSQPTSFASRADGGC